MYCPKQFVYILRRGDNLEQIAQRYKTTPQMIISANPGLNTNKLRSGMAIVICPGENGEPEPQAKVQSELQKLQERHENLRHIHHLWLQHIFWSRMMLTSISERLPDQSHVYNRLMETPKNISQLFSKVYTPDTISQLEILISEHIQIKVAIMTSLREKRRRGNETDDLIANWTLNATNISKTLCESNKRYQPEQLQKAIQQHLQLCSQWIFVRMQSNYQKEIELFASLEKQTSSICDYISQIIDN